MNAPVNPIPGIPAPRALALMQVTIKGKIIAARRHDQTRFTRIATPAPDPYSRPQVVEVRSKAQLGSKDDEIIVVAQLGGYTRKPFRFTDKDTGEVQTVVPVDMTLDAVE